MSDLTVHARAGRAGVEVFHRMGPFGGLVSTGERPPRGLQAWILGDVHHRPDLARRLGAPATTPAVELVCLAYERLGPGGLDLVEGPCSILISDQPARVLVAHRGPVGTEFPLYYRTTGQGVTVGSTLRGIIRGCGFTTWDPDYFAEYLNWAVPGYELPTDRTPLTGVRRVRPGSRVALRYGGGAPRAEVTRYWDWRVWVGRADDTLTLEEAGQEFRRLLSESVDEFVSRGPVAADLSGGKDSTAVALLAARRLAAVAGGPLHAMSVVYDHPHLRAERDEIRAGLAADANIRSYLLTGDSLLDFDWFREPIPYHCEPYPRLPSCAMERARIEAAAAVGARTYLTGLGGDHLQHGNRFYLAGLLRSGRWFRLLAEGRRWAAARNENLWRFLARYAVGPHLPVWFRGRVGGLFQGGFARWPRVEHPFIPPWVRPEFARRSAMWERAVAQDRGRRDPTAEAGQDRLELESTAGDWGGWHVAARHGILSAHPFLSPRLLRFVLSVPRRLKEQPGRLKPLLEEATKGVLPDRIRLRSTKRSFNHAYFVGLNGNLPRLVSMIRQSRVPELGVLDVEALATCIRELAAGVAGSAAASRLNSAISLVAWFDRFEQDRREGEE